MYNSERVRDSKVSLIKFLITNTLKKMQNKTKQEGTKIEHHKQQIQKNTNRRKNCREKTKISI